MLLAIKWGRRRRRRSQVASGCVGACLCWCMLVLFLRPRDMACIVIVAVKHAAAEVAAGQALSRKSASIPSQRACCLLVRAGQYAWLM